MVDLKNELYVELLTLGFDENAIKRAMALTNDKDKAVELILNFQEDEKIDTDNNQQLQQQQNQQNQQGHNINMATVNLFQGIDPYQLLNIAQQQQSEFQDDGKNYKMVFLVRMDLKMGVGKIAAQVAHAALGAYQQIVTIVDDENQEQDSNQLKNRYTHCLSQWEEKGSAKIVLKVESKEELIQLEQLASQKGINTFIIEDAGRTQVEPNTITVCAIGPDDDQTIGSITKHLKLL